MVHLQDRERLLGIKMFALYPFACVFPSPLLKAPSSLFIIEKLWGDFPAAQLGIRLAAASALDSAIRHPLFSHSISALPFPASKDDTHFLCQLRYQKELDGDQSKPLGPMLWGNGWAWGAQMCYLASYNNLYSSHVGNRGFYANMSVSIHPSMQEALS